MNYALSFAETGHLCMATLHANNANQAIERIMHLVPESRHQQLLFDLAFNLKGVIAQQLVPTIDGNGRRAAFEILLGTPVVKDTLLKGNLGELKDIMKQSREAGMVTFDQSLFELYSEGVISYRGRHLLRRRAEVRRLRERSPPQDQARERHDRRRRRLAQEHLVLLIGSPVTKISTVPCLRAGDFSL